ncbi:protein-L-isoaspartate(D-aspartate) O-methyltransferase [Candidatus Latescibacterota bacterium]
MDYEVARARMVKEQLIRHGITDEHVLRAMSIVPRHYFIDQGFWPRAYGDYPLPIGNNQTISQPYIVALMCQELALPGTGEKVLEVGTGSGYQTAVLAIMGQRVYTIERHQGLFDNAQRILNGLGVTGVTFRVGDGTLGWEEEAPFEGIVVTAGAPDIPDGLVDQLAVGGRLVIPVGDRDNQRLIVVEKGEKIIEKRDAGGCLFVPLVGERGWEGE